MRRFIVTAVFLAAANGATACPQGAKCLTVPESMKRVVTGAVFLKAPPPPPAPYAIGDVIPGDQVNVLLNTGYYGLPASDGSFWYIRADDHIYRMDPTTMQITAHVRDRLR